MYIDDEKIAKKIAPKAVEEFVRFIFNFCRHVLQKIMPIFQGFRYLLQFLHFMQ